MNEASIATDLSRHPLTAWTGQLNLPDFSRLSAALPTRSPATSVMRLRGPVSNIRAP